MFDNQTKKFCSAVVDALPDIPENLMQAWIESPVRLQEVLKTAICPVAEAGQPTLRLLIPSLIIPATDGRQTLALANAVFTGWIDPDLKNWDCDLPDEARPETAVNVHELTVDATFQQMFGEGKVRLDKSCLTQGQIIQFVTKYHKHLHPHATFFLFKSHGEFFVARVSWYDFRRLKVNVNHFSDDYVRLADHHYRVVLPQLALKP